MSKSTAPSKVFDPIKLDAMTEPLSVRVEKLKGNVRTPIPLPPGEDGSQQGTNWAKSDVLGLEQFLVNDWSGGGLYEIIVSDSVGSKMDWRAYYPPVQYPERTPPTLQAAEQPMAARITPAAPSPTPAPQVQRMSYPSAFPHGLPQQPPATTPVATATAAPAPVYYQPPVYGPAPYTPSWRAPAPEAPAPAVAALDAERRQIEMQLKEAQAAMQRMRDEQREAQHKAELERTEAKLRSEQAAMKEQFEGLKTTIAQLAQTLTAAAAPKVDSEAAALREEMRRLKDEQDRRDREREMRELVQRQQDDARRQQEQFQQQILLLQQQNANKGPDPMMMLMQEQMRQQAEVAREQARMHSAQMDSLKMYMMTPRDLMQLSKESQSGVDQLARQMSNTYQDIFNMQRQAVEVALQLNAPPDGIAPMIDKNIDRLASIADRYLGNKTREAVAVQQSQAQIAAAQAQAMTAQAAAIQAQAGLSGASQAPVIDVAPAVEQVTAAAHPKRLGHTDEEWFGPIMPRIEQLRAGVNEYMTSLAQDPIRVDEDGDPEGISPFGVAKSVMTAIGLIHQQQVKVMALDELVGKGRIVDFVNVLIPDAPEVYRSDTIDLITRALQGEDLDALMAGGEDDDEDDAEEAPAPAPVKNGTHAKPHATPIPAKAGRPARA